MTWTIFNEDAIAWSRNYKGEKFHALFTDAPYHLTSIVKRFGKSGSAPAKFGTDGVFSRSSRGFMNQQWDGGDIAFRPDTWEAFKGVMHNGAFGMAFSASRNWHRMAVAIEDAGFIIHPTMFFLWVQSQGFPKATKVKGYPEFEGYKYGLQALKPAVEPVIVFSKSKGLWYTEIVEDMERVSRYLEELWKPQSREDVVKAGQRVNSILLKMLNCPDPIYSVNGLNVETAKKSSIFLRESKSGVMEKGAGIVRENVTANTGENSRKEFAANVKKSSMRKTQENLGGIVVPSADMPPKSDPCWKTPFEMGIDIDTVVGMLQSNLERGRLDLSMIWLWSSIWEGVCDMVNKFTIETNEKTITALKILSYSLQRLTQTNTQSEKNSTRELWLYAQDVTRNFIGLLTCLKTLEPIVKVVPEPVIIFQKPYNGRPVDNILSTGAGVLSVDGARIPLKNDDEYVINEFEDGMKPFGSGAGHKYKSKKIHAPQSNPANRRGIVGTDLGISNASTERFREAQRLSVEKANALGRYPANLILDEQAAEALDRQSGVLKSGDPNGSKRNAKTGFSTGITSGAYELTGFGDSGGASRFFFNVEEQIDEADPFFYCGKVMPKERGAGLDGEKNPHPTLKPIKLTTYLAKLLLPPKEYSPRRLFVPFSGVASEMIGGVLAGWDEVVGVEFDTENNYVGIGEQRLKYWESKTGLE